LTISERNYLFLKKYLHLLRQQASWNIEAVYYIVKGNSLLLLWRGEDNPGLKEARIVKKRNNYNRLEFFGRTFCAWLLANYFKENGKLKIS